VVVVAAALGTLLTVADVIALVTPATTGR